VVRLFGVLFFFFVLSLMMIPPAERVSVL